MTEVLKYLMYGLHTIVSILLIVLVVSQTARHEGLGVVGGGSSQQLRGRAGFDEQLQTYTRWAAIAFMILSALLFMFARKFGWS
jgi:protein translocase SecG subunit